MYENQAVQYSEFTQYDGANGSTIFDRASADQPGSWSYTEDASVLTIKQDFGNDIFEQWSAPEGGYFFWRSNGTLASGVTAEEFQATFVKLGDMVNRKVTSAVGIEAVTNLDAGESTTVTVTLDKAFSDTNYDCAPVVVGSLVVNQAFEVTSCSIVDERHVNVTVHNTGEATLSGEILIQAVAP